MSKLIPFVRAGACALAWTLSGAAHAESTTKSVASLGPDGQPPSLAAPVERDASAPDSEGARLRGGFSLNGGAAFGLASGPILSMAVRLGVQVTRAFGLYYQQSPMIFLASNEGSTAAGFLDLNSALASLTLADILDVAAGPSVDYYAAGSCGMANDCAGASGWQLGMHGRLALTLGGRDRETGRRSGFSVGLDEHPMFGGGSVLALTTLGVGGEWY
jgi:hypothetical protein